MYNTNKRAARIAYVLNKLALARLRTLFGVHLEGVCPGFCALGFTVPLLHTCGFLPQWHAQCMRRQRTFLIMVVLPWLVAVTP